MESYQKGSLRRDICMVADAVSDQNGRGQVLPQCWDRPSELAVGIPGLCVVEGRNLLSASHPRAMKGLPSRNPVD